MNEHVDFSFDEYEIRGPFLVLYTDRLPKKQRKSNRYATQCNRNATQRNRNAKSAIID